MFILKTVLVLAISCAVAAPSQVPDANPAPHLSPAVRDKVLDLIAQFGMDRELPAMLANPLGLSATGQTWPYRQVRSTLEPGKQSGPAHWFTINSGSQPDLMLVSLAGNTVLMFRTNRDGQLMSAISYDRDTKRVSTRTHAEAQPDLYAELSYWARNIDSISEWSYCGAEVKGAHPVSRQKKLENCTLLIQSVSQTPADLASAYVDRSQAYDYDQDSGKSQIGDLNQAVKTDPENALAWAELCSSVNFLNHDTQQAMRDCSKAIALDPKLPQAWTYRADIHLNQKQYDEAIADYNHAIELNPNWMWPWDNRGEAYLRSNRMDLAIQDFNQVIKLNPDYAMGFLDRGIAEMRKNDLDAAMSDFEMGIKVDSDCGACFVGRGLAERSKGKVALGDADIVKGKSMSAHATDNFIEDGIAVP